MHLWPLALPSSLVLLTAAGAAGWVVGRWSARRRGFDVDSPLTRLLLVAVLASRLAFVWSSRRAYLDAPLDIVDIRDGGWSPEVGMIAAWLYALALVRRHPPLKRTLLAATGVASAVWIGGSFMLLLAPRPPTPVPAIAVSDLNGAPASLRSFEGRPIVLNLWATWCPPCRRELPVLQQAQAAHPEMHVVFLNQGETADQVRRYLTESGLDLRHVLLDGKGLAAAPYGSVLPTTLFFDAGGHLVGLRTGELSSATLAQRLDALSAPPR